MITVKENTTLVGISELRTDIDKILAKAQEGAVFIEKGHKPMTVLLSNESYAHMQQLLETAEDIVLGTVADARYRNSRQKDYVSIESLKKWRYASQRHELNRT